MSHGPPSSSATRRKVLEALLVEGAQTTKVIVDPRRLEGEEHGIPDSVLANYPDGVPLDLNPAWPLDLDLGSDPVALGVSLSFSGRICRCRLPWRAISMIAVGLGGVSWEHDDPKPPPRASAPPRKGTHLRLVD